MRFPKITIFHKMLFAPIVGVVLFLLFLYYSYTQNEQSKANLQSIYEVRFPILDIASRNISLLENISKYLKDAVLANEISWIDQTKALDMRLRINVAQMGKISGDEALTKELTHLYNEYYKNAIELSSMMIAQSSDLEKLNALITKTNGFYDKTMQRFMKIQEEQRKSYEGTIQESISHLDSILFIGLIFGAASMIIIIAITFFISLSTRKQIGEVLNTMRNITSGKPDFDSRIKKNSEDEIGELVDYFNLFTDKLEQDYKALESAKQEAERNYDELVKTQKKLVESEKMASLGNLVAGVAHEINTPLGIAYTTASSIDKLYKSSTNENGEIIEEKREAILSKTNRGFPLILNNLKRASDLVKSFKRVSVDQHVDELREIEICEYINDLANSLQYEYSKKGYSLLTPKEKRCMIKTYPGAIGQIITNLVMNSIKHGFKERKSGVMEIDIECGDKNLLLSYQDDGCGIEEKNLQKVFDPFFTTDKQDGSGLGMHILYNLVTHKLQGTISLTSQVGEGVKVVIDIPREG